MSAPKLRAVYLDVGGPLVDDSGIDQFWNAYLIQSLPEVIGRSVTLEEVEEVNRRVMATYAPSLYSATIWHFVRPDRDAFRKLRADFDALDFPSLYKVRPEAPAVCRQLAAHYTLAIAANQPVSAESFLERHGLLQYFTFREMSDALPFSKPDLRFFLYISEKLGIPLTESVMVGDRQDNDIVPAGLLGMKTIRVMTGLYRDQQVRMPKELPDLMIDSLAQLPAAINDLRLLAN